ncbi:alcohol dehydrogenase [Colletotrichum scovillei]|uniref:Alcohol dehydrogenase n=1 Tax=Colletotrichum scovillei TaxID=1209932 RepID=A0A9P7R6H2_9PEZI|nr:alcohol dehydrogenase [Colletotrichum scovillei]KAG7070099.1 alcohol dehydrogenase [Colletotrichum scovillei]KAG7078347.1 alcohol dehydrogenase [Colletotrichum scovillei]
MSDFMDIWALTQWNEPLQKLRQPIPTPTASEVLLRVTHAGVCHSDLHTAEGFYDAGGGKRFYVKDRGIQLPVALGHEILGEVTGLGPDVTSISIGSRQIVYPWLGCGSCTRCMQGEDNLCGAQRGLGTFRHGGFAEYIVVPHPKYLVDLGNLDPAVACTFGCSGITTLSAVSKVLPLPPDEPVLLIGAGGLGLAAIAVLKAFGHKSVIATDITDEKLNAAAAAGATKTVNISGPSATKDILAATNGPVIAVIDFVGVMGGSVEFSLVANIFKGLTIFSNITGNLEHFRQVIRMAKEGKLSSVLVQKMDWNLANDAMDLLKAGKAMGRIVLVK